MSCVCNIDSVAPVPKIMEHEMSSSEVLENDSTIFRRILLDEIVESFFVGRRIDDLSDYLFIVIQNTNCEDAFMYINSYEFHGLLPLLFLSLQTKQEATFNEIVWGRKRNDRLLSFFGSAPFFFSLRRFSSIVMPREIRSMMIGMIALVTSPRSQ